MLIGWKQSESWQQQPETEIATRQSSKPLKTSFPFVKPSRQAAVKVAVKVTLTLRFCGVALALLSLA